jgi:hypothetical protein
VDYPGNVLNALTDGCVLDLRFKLAVEFVKAGLVPQPPEPDCVLVEPARAVAYFAFEVAQEMIAIAQERNLIAPMPEGEIPSVVKNQIKRNAEAQALQQWHAQRVMTELAGPLAPMGRMPLHG